MFSATPAFTLLTPTFPTTTFRGVPLCNYTPSAPIPFHSSSFSSPRMTSSSRLPPRTSQLTPLGSFKAFPPPEMTFEWAEAVQRLAGSFSGITLSAADQVLDEADGDEDVALRLLTEMNKSEIQLEREKAVEVARAGGDLGRVSAIKEAELRRRATGSAKDFFKGYVEIEGQYVDQGYVDEEADIMGKLMGKVGGWFGKKSVEDEKAKELEV